MKNVKLIKIVLIIVSLFISLSCGIRKSYKAPIVDKRYIFKADSLLEKNLPLEQINWKTFFKDKQLQSFIDSALSNNLQHLIAQNNSKIAQKQYQKAFVSYFPILNGSVSGQKQDPPANEATTAALNFSWEIDIWGKLNSHVKLSEALLLKSQTVLKSVKTLFISNLATNYYLLIEADSRLEKLVEIVRIREKILKNYKQLKHAGLANQTDIEAAVWQLNNAKNAHRQAMQNKQRHENEIIKLLGKPQSIISRSNYSRLMEPFNQKTILNYNFINNRPDVLGAELEVRAAFEKHNMAVASLYPSLKINLTAAMQSTAGFFSGFVFFKRAVADIFVPIVDQVNLQIEEDIAKIELENSILNFRNVLLNASLEIDETVKNYHFADKNFNISINQEQQLKRAYLQTKSLFEAGKVNNIQVLLAQESYFLAQLETMRTQTERLNKSVLIYRSFGGS